MLLIDLFVNFNVRMLDMLSSERHSSLRHFKDDSIYGADESLKVFLVTSDENYICIVH